VHVLNYRNGSRIITYTIKAPRGSGTVCMNGPAALLFSPGDEVIVLSYALIDFEAGKKFNPAIVFPEAKTNKINS
jgi:aspartate 1-decarboxylase